jgi:hypothetical protein
MVLVEIDSAFGTAYWSSHRRRLLRSRPWLVNDSVHTAAQALAQKGFIDVPIMIGRWQAWKVMRLRQAFGYTWVPGMLQPNVAAAPGTPVGVYRSTIPTIRRRDRDPGVRATSPAMVLSLRRLLALRRQLPRPQTPFQPQAPISP